LRNSHKINSMDIELVLRELTMNTTNLSDEALTLVKALASVPRIQIIGALARGACTAAQLSEQVGLRGPALIRHLETLEKAGLVKTGNGGAEGRYIFNPRQVENLAGQLSGLRESADLSGSPLEETERKMLTHFLEADGRIKQLPNQPKKLLPVLKYVLQNFEAGKRYSEKEVNAILAPLFKDTAALRRYLIDYKMLARECDGSTYWLPDNG
jgi:hypothetical protein